MRTTPLTLVAATVIASLVIGSLTAGARGRAPDAAGLQDAAKVEQPIPDTCSNFPGGALIGRPAGKKAYAAVQWTDTAVLNVIFKDGDDPWNQTVRSKVQDIVREWEDYANMRFEFNNEKSADITIQLTRDATYGYGVYQSLLGPNSRGARPSMWLIFRPNTPDAELKRVILHEFGHALGLIHEQKRPDLNFGWHREAVLEAYRFTGWSDKQIEEQVIRPFLAPAVVKSPFDRYSIMIYPIPPKLASIVVDWSMDLSPMDKSLINRLYPFQVATLGEKVLRLGKPQQAAINAPGQVASYRLTVDRKGFYTIEVRGEEPCLVALFGSPYIRTQGGGPPAGEGKAVKIVAELDPTNVPDAGEDPGTYFLDVRHQKPRTQTGTFMVTLRSE
jgi:hypothetical protein